MATTTRQLGRTLFQVSRQIPLKRKCTPQTQCLSTRPPRAPAMQCRHISSTPRRRAEKHTSSYDQPPSMDDDDPSPPLDISQPPPGGYKTPNRPITLADLNPAELADYNMLSPKDQSSYLSLQNHYAAEFESAGIDVFSDPEGELPDPQMDKMIDDLERQNNRETEPLDFPDVPLARSDVGFWALGEEDDEFTQVEDGPEDWDESAITSVAHSELDLHREIREYTRVVAWDMPLLQKFAKPFQPPSESTPLRFRYTTYMGEYHPAAKKVVVQFCPSDLTNLTPAQILKLKKLAGPRYNPELDIVKMSCEQFEAPAQNKRYLGDLVGKLVKEAKDEREMFEDVPLDLRHHTYKKKVEFPEGWKLSRKERVRELEAVRGQQALLDEGMTMQDRRAVDGREVVEEYVRATVGRGGGQAQQRRVL